MREGDERGDFEQQIGPYLTKDQFQHLLGTERRAVSLAFDTINVRTFSDKILQIVIIAFGVSIENRIHDAGMITDSDLHLLVSWASRTRSEEKLSSRSNRSSAGPSGSRKVGGNT